MLMNRLDLATTGEEIKLPQPLYLPQQLERQAAACPDAQAVTCGGTCIDYRELNSRVNRLAHFLRSLGAGPNVPIAVSIPRSLEAVIAVLAVVKSGSAYVPLDPSYPAARLRLMAEESRVPLVLVRSVNEAAPAIPGGPRILALDTAAGAIAACSSANPPVTAGPDDLIYIIFTSGSTGTPKGAGVLHRGFANLLSWFCGAFSLGPDDRTLLISSLSFDLTQKNLFAPLLTGGHLIVHSDPTYNPTAISRAIAAHRVTTVNCTPSVFYPLVEGRAREAATELATLRWVFLGGEPILTARLRGWTGRPGFQTTIVNTYGPTECSDIVASYRLTAGDLAGAGPVPIGRAIANTRLEILDANLQPATEGQPGELCVSGQGVGSGYVNDAALTASRFLPGPDGRFYRTGDVVRRRPDGEIEFLGRTDHQVKVRGFRIELPEIEAALRSHPGVKDGVVVVRPDGETLVAYIVAHPDAGTNWQAIRSFLAARLPEYMVPSQAVMLAALPLTPNGKVDRGSLPALAPAPPPPGAAAPPALGPGGLGQTLTALFAEVLHLESVHPEENFFEIGGSSLLAGQLHTRLTQTLGRELPPTLLFESPSVRDLTRRLEAGPAPSAATAVSRDRAARQREALARMHDRRPAPKPEAGR